ncbi:MAG: hypothetical protein QXP46_04685 [Archaeoglobaceae archaeon]
MGLQYTSLKGAIQQRKIVFDDELVAIASDPFADINEAIFEVEFSNFLNGTAHRIYLDPREYFRRTHFTEDMKNIIKKVLSRVASISDESYAIILDTTFGGGKTHTLLAIYHLFKNKDVAINYQEVKGF